MTEEPIAQIGVDAAGSLFVRPQHRTFPQIYRAAMEVAWDEARGYLVAPSPRSWTPLRWFQQILAAVEDEYGTRLQTSAATDWTSCPPALRAQIELFEVRLAAEARGSVSSEEAQRRQDEEEARFARFMLDQKLEDAAALWSQARYGDYVRLLAPCLEQLSPAQRKRIDIAKRRAGGPDP